MNNNENQIIVEPQQSESNQQTIPAEKKNEKNPAIYFLIPLLCLIIYIIGTVSTIIIRIVNTSTGEEQIQNTAAFSEIVIKIINTISIIAGLAIIPSLIIVIIIIVSKSESKKII